MGRSVTRRQFLVGITAVAAGAGLEACSLPTAGQSPGSASPRATATPAPSGPQADLLLRNATVLTMDPAHSSADADQVVLSCRSSRARRRTPMIDTNM